jgi:hypothetical protein
MIADGDPPALDEDDGSSTPVESMVPVSSSEASSAVLLGGRIERFDDEGSDVSRMVVLIVSPRRRSAEAALLDLCQCRSSQRLAELRRASGP